MVFKINQNLPGPEEFICNSWWTMHLFYLGAQFEVCNAPGKVYKYYIKPKSLSDELVDYHNNYKKDVRNKFLLDFFILSQQDIIQLDNDILTSFTNDIMDLYETYMYFILTYGGENPELPKMYMTNIGMKILEIKLDGNPYFYHVCEIGRNVEETMLNTPEAIEIIKKYRNTI